MMWNMRSYDVEHAKKNPYATNEGQGQPELGLHL